MHSIYIIIFRKTSCNKPTSDVELLILEELLIKFEFFIKNGHLPHYHS